MTTSDRLRQRAERFLALALDARGRGDLELAEQLTARAMQCLDEANGTDEVPDLPPPTAEPIPQPQQQQQRQQTQPDEDGEPE